MRQPCRSSLGLDSHSVVCRCHSDILNENFLADDKAMHFNYHKSHVKGNVCLALKTKYRFLSVIPEICNRYTAWASCLGKDLNVS